MAKRKAKITARMQVVRSALVTARPIIERYLEIEIVGSANPEKKARRGSIKQVGYFFNADTITDSDIQREVQRHTSALAKIDAALKVVRP